MPSCAHAPFHLLYMPAARQKERDPVAMLHPGITRLSNAFVNSKNMQQLGPKPLRRIDAPDELQIVDREIQRMRIDLRGFSHGSMILPENEQGIGVLLKSRQQSQRSAAFI